MPHNHPPHCCCHGQSPTPASQRPCPSCPEHGELATLSQPHAIAYNPADEDEPIRDRCGRDDICDGRNDPPRSLVPSYCPTCHQKAGRPHTEYRPNGPGTVQ